MRDGRLRAGRAAQVLERWGRGSPGHGPHSTGRQHRVFSYGDLRVAAGERGEPARPVRGRVPNEAVPGRVLHDGDPGGGAAFRISGDGRVGTGQVREVRRRPRTGEAVSGHRRSCTTAHSKARKASARSAPLGIDVALRAAWGRWLSLEREARQNLGRSPQRCTAQRWGPAGDER